MSSQEQHAALLLNSLNEIGPARIRSLLKKFGSCRAALDAGVAAWVGVPLFDDRLLASIELNMAVASKEADDDMNFALRSGVKILLSHCGPYPALLSHISYPPPVLYVLGEDISVERPAVALVGSRRCSYYGEKMAGSIAEGLAAAGVTTVSGLARGVDTIVHEATLKSGGKTWAVIGSGLAAIYPPENIALAKRVESLGAVISEFPLRTRPFPGHFPRRNRIIAGLSTATVVIEGGEKSGSLITARLAAEEGRDVLAVPGPVTSPLSAAPNRLLQSGAALVQSAGDVLIEIGILKLKTGSAGTAPTERKDMPPRYHALLDFLSAEPVPREILARRLRAEANQLSSLLFEMEMKGLIRTVTGGCVIRT